MAPLSAEPAAKWIELDGGLHYAEFDSPQKADAGDSKILVVRADPRLYDLQLLCLSELGDKAQGLTVRQWAEKHGLVAAINAGMYQPDEKSNVGYMQNFAHKNNPRVNSKYLSIAAFNAKAASLAPFMLFDMEQHKIPEIAKDYHSVVQNLRLIKRPRINVWTQQDKQWSEAALGQDKQGKVLFIFSRSPYTMHDFNEILLRLPIEIECAQHLDGGPPASFYLSTKSVTIEKVGSYESKFFEDHDNKTAWPLPNVIGLTKKQR
ncbi:MAG: phosphodiester glycosidase family protein [Verrucomicrobia bacterium]|nr:phosphodiester glycosidase family protein [Verrucomicrobiota bacterium]